MDEGEEQSTAELMKKDFVPKLFPIF